jgi:hypothetical protein
MLRADGLKREVIGGLEATCLADQRTQTTLLVNVNYIYVGPSIMTHSYFDFILSQ